MTNGETNVEVERERISMIYQEIKKEISQRKKEEDKDRSRKKGS